MVVRVEIGQRMGVGLGVAGGGGDVRPGSQGGGPGRWRQVKLRQPAAS